MIGGLTSSIEVQRVVTTLDDVAPSKGEALEKLEATLGVDPDHAPVIQQFVGGTPVVERMVKVPIELDGKRVQHDGLLDTSRTFGLQTFAVEAEGPFVLPPFVILRRSQEQTLLTIDRLLDQIDVNGGMRAQGIVTQLDTLGRYELAELLVDLPVACLAVSAAIPDRFAGGAAAEILINGTGSAAATVGRRGNEASARRHSLEVHHVLTVVQFQWGRIKQYASGDEPSNSAIRRSIDSLSLGDALQKSKCIPDASFSFPAMVSGLFFDRCSYVRSCCCCLLLASSYPAGYRRSTLLSSQQKED